MAGTTHAPRKAWVAVISMILGFAVLAVAFIYHNNVVLYVVGGVIGVFGIVMAKVANIMSQTE